MQRKIICMAILLLAVLTAERSFGASAGVTCAADGSSTQVLPARASRLSYAIINDSAIDIRLATVATGTPDLDDTNSIVIKAGAAISDSFPGNDIGRLVCMSTTAGTAVIHVKEVLRP